MAIEEVTGLVLNGRSKEEAAADPRAAVQTDTGVGGTTDVSKTNDTDKTATAGVTNITGTKETTTSKKETSSKKASKRVREAILKVFGITQYTEPEYFDWTDGEKKALNGSAHDIACIIINRLFIAGMGVQELYVSIHDKDKTEKWDMLTQSYITVDEKRHIHVAGKFIEYQGRTLGGTIQQIAKAVGVAPQYVEKAKTGRYGYDNMLAYLVHAKQPWKYQYDPSAVASVGSASKDTGQPLYKPYIEVYAERKKSWDSGRYVVQKKHDEESADELYYKIITGNVTRSQVYRTQSMFLTYCTDPVRFDRGFACYAAQKIDLAIMAMENKEFLVTTLFIGGVSGSGKSWLTKELSFKLRKDVKEKLGQDWSVCRCAASNPFDEYQGQEIVVMDDLRGTALTASDWLKLMNIDDIDPGSARYKNKFGVAARVVLINSERPMLPFFYYTKATGGGDRSEALDQFFRRVTARLDVYRVGDSEVRRVKVSHMNRVDAYTVEEPGTGSFDRCANTLTLHFTFDKDIVDMSYDETLQHVSDLVIARNSLKLAK